MEAIEAIEEETPQARRQAALLRHLQTGSACPLLERRGAEAPPLQRRATAAAADSPDDVVIVSALRTPITKARKGGLRDTSAEDLLATVLKATLERSRVDPAAVGDVVVGSVLGSNVWRANQARMACFLAGMPETVPVRTVNRQCSSGLQACADVAASIKAGYYDVGIGAGVETMTLDPMKFDDTAINPKVFADAKARSCLMPMGITSENVAAKYGISREVQDKMAVESHARAAAARRSGRFKDEIVPVHTKVKNAKTGEMEDIIVFEDDGIREGVTAEALAKLAPAFKKGGSTTAGNSSQVSDGAGAVLLMRRSYATAKNFPIIGVWRSFSVVGVDPALMGVGPAYAIPEALKMAGVGVNDIAVYELNEAFASQATYSAVKLGLDPAKVNPNGGSIALGHPLGATGARAMATLLHELGRRGPGARYGVVSMCIGSGMGAAAVVERGPNAPGPR